MALTTNQLWQVVKFHRVCITISLKLYIVTLPIQKVTTYSCTGLSSEQFEYPKSFIINKTNFLVVKSF